MDAYSISYTLPSRRGSSRVYKDLAACLSYGRSAENENIEDFVMDAAKKLRFHSSSKPAHIGIIGAGIAGLRCADILLQHGFKVTILEARNRIGGRAHQGTLPNGATVDLGPNWIHGTEHNPILDIAKDTDTATHTWPENGNVFGEDGETLEDGKELSDSMWSIIVDAFKYSSENTATIDPNQSLYDFFADRITETFPDAHDDRKRRIVMQMADLWGAFVGSSVQTQSLKFFWLEECVDGENLFCAGTYQKILAAIAKPALDGADVKLSTRITRIETSAGSITAFSDNGLEFNFNEIVMTAPLGWLQRNKQTFRPPLPQRFSQAIDSIGYGCLEKVYITFPRAFWLEEGITPGDQPFTGFTQWLSPLYAKDTNPNLWNHEAVDIATLPESCAHATLLFYIFGDQSHEQAAQLAALPSQEKKQAFLMKHFKPYFSRLPHYDANSKDCRPIDYLATTWVMDELAGNGSYSTFRTGLQEGDKDVEILREGLPGRNLWFAGEHTAPFVALGTTTGAYWSGEAVGNRMVEAYGMEVNSKITIPISQDITNVDRTKEFNVRGFADDALEK